MARISAFDEHATDLRRTAVALAIVAAHVVVIILLARRVGHPADVADITYVALPIYLEDRPREPVHSEPQHAAVARERATQQHTEPLVGESARSANKIAEPAGEPDPPIDWRAEIQTSAHALEQRAAIESHWRPLDGSRLPAWGASSHQPACPYEQCETGWGEDLGVFDPSIHSRAGRIEEIAADKPTLPNGSPNTTGTETIRWVSNWCYTILLSQDPQRQGMYKCVLPLGKRAARGDLFDHMNGSRPSQSHETDDAPWISYGFTLGAARDGNKGP